MAEVFLWVLVGVVVVGVVCSLGSFVGRKEALDRLGRGGMALRDGSDRGPEPAGGGTSKAMAEEEVRQMVTARNARRVRRGEAPIDIEAEVAALTRPQADPGLEDEVRSLVRARNARRARRGEAPLDEEAEVARQLEGL